MPFLSTRRGRLDRLLTRIVPLAAFLLAASTASAATFYVDLDGGSDTAFDGSSPTVTGVGTAGPFMTINRALTAAGNGDTVVILASTYPESFTVTEDNLTITARPEGGDLTVRLTGSVAIGTSGNGADGVRLAAETIGGNAGRFILNTPLLDIENGSLALGSGLATIGEGTEVTIERTSGALTGAPVYASTPNVLYNGTGPVTATAELRPLFVGSATNPDPRLTVTFANAASSTLTLAGGVELGTAAVVDVDDADAVAGTFTVTGDVDFVDGGRYGTLVVTSGGVLNVDDNLSADGLMLQGTGVVDASGLTLTLFGSFAQMGTDTQFAPAGSLAFDGSGAYAFTPEGGFTLTNLSIGVAPSPNPTVTFGGDASVSNLFTVASGSTAALGGNLVNILPAADSNVDGTAANGGVAFLGAGSTIAGQGVYDQILVVGDTSTPTVGEDVVTVAGSNFQFTGQMLLAGGGLVNGAAADVSPLGPNASVLVQIGITTNRITGGRFNADNVLFNLRYTGTNAAYAVGSEFDTEEIRNLIVDAQGVVDALAVGLTGPVGGPDTIDGTVSLSTSSALTVRFPNAPVSIDRALSVGSGVLLAASAGNDLSLLSGSAGFGTNTLGGTIGGPGRLVLGSGLAGSLPTVTGAPGASRIETAGGLRIANSAAATIAGIGLINTFVTDGPGSSLSLGIVADGAPGFAAAGNVTGTVTLGGSFTQTTDIEYQDDLTLSGAVTLGIWDVVFNDADGQATSVVALNGQTVAGTADIATTGQFRFIAPSTFNPRNATVPGVDVIADVALVSDGTVRLALRIAAVFNADTPSDGDANGDDALDLAVDGTVILAVGGSVINENNPADLEVVTLGRFNFTDQQPGIFSPFALTMLGRPDLQTFTSDPGALSSLPEVGVVYNGATQAAAQFAVVDFVQISGRFNLAGHTVSASRHVVFNGSAPVVNLQDQTPAQEADSDGVMARGSALNPYSEFRLVGAENGTMTLNNLAQGIPGAYIGAGVDLVLAKASDAAVVELAGGALLFDDQFTPAGVPAAFVMDMPSDETFWLDRGVFAAGTEATRGTLYVNLDHENSIQARQAEAATDDGQGFAFRGASTDLRPMAQIAGTVQKRITSDPNAPGGPTEPGRLMNPLGDRTGDYAEYTLDFESIPRAPGFGRRTIRTTFVPTPPGGRLGLPIDDGIAPGVDIGSTGNFSWHVSSDPTLGADTEFNIEARYDGYTLAPGETVDELRLVRRQAGGELQNPYSLVGSMYDNYIIDPTPVTPGSGDEQTVVVAQTAEALLGQQGTLFAFGLQALPPAALDVVQIQVVNNAPGALAPVDVYVGEELVANNLRFGEATAYQTVGGVDGTVTLAVAIAPENSTSPTGALRMAAHEVTQGGSYAIVVFNDGADATPGDAYDSQILSVTTTQASSSTAVEMFAVNAAPDAPSLDIGVENAARFFTGLAYGRTSAVPMTGVDGALLRYLVYDAGAAVRFYTGSLDLSSAEGERGLLIAQGLRTPIPTQPSRAFQLAFVRPTGAVIHAANTTPGEEGLAAPTEFALHGTAPNPFRTHTSVRFDLPEAAEVTVEVYDALGRRVAQSVQSAMAPGANLSVAVDGTGLAAGLYVYRLVARGETESWSRTGQIVVAR